jgi:small subunit ribosomal protein S15
MKPPEIIQKVVELAKEGHSTSLIGMYLRDQYGVPNVRLATGKSIMQILSEHDIKLSIPEDLSNLLKRVTRLQAHLAAHKHDIANKRALTLLEAKVRRLAKYYKREGMLPPDWKYTSTEELGGV